MIKRSKSSLRYEKIKINRAWLLLVLLVFILSFFIRIWPLVFLGLFCVINTSLLSFKRYFDGPIDFELSNAAAILMTIEYGVGYGIAAAILTKAVSMFYNKRIKINYFFMMSSYVVAAVLADLPLKLNVVQLGILVTFLSNMYLGLIRKFVVQYSMMEVILYGLTNILFNIVFFIGFSEIILFLMI